MSNTNRNHHIVYIDHSWGEVAVSKRVTEDSNDNSSDCGAGLLGFSGTGGTGNVPRAGLYVDRSGRGAGRVRRERLLATLAYAQRVLISSLVAILAVLVLGVAGCLDSERGGQDWRGVKMKSRHEGRP